MIPNVLKLFFERVNLVPDSEIINFIQKESLISIPLFIDKLIDLSFDSNMDKNLINLEAKRILNFMIDSPFNIILLRILFELQGQKTDQRIKTIKGNIFLKALPSWKQDSIDSMIREIMVRPNGVINIMKTLAELIGNNRSPDVAFKIALNICKPPKSVDLDDHYSRICKQIIDIIQVTKISKISEVQQKNNDIHKEYLQFARCVAMESVHLVASVNEEYARIYLLERLFSDFLTILNQDNDVDDTRFMQPEIVIGPDDLLHMLQLQLSLLDTHKSNKFVKDWMRNLAAVYWATWVASNKGNCNTTDQHGTIARLILARMIETCSRNDVHSFVRTLCGVEDSIQNQWQLHHRLSVRRSLSTFGAIEVAVRCDRLVFNENRDFESPATLSRAMVNVLQALASGPGRRDVASSLFIWLFERRCDLSTSAPDLCLDDSSRSDQRLFRDSLLYCLLTEMGTDCVPEAADVVRVAQIAINQYSHARLANTEVNSDLDENLNYVLRMIKLVLDEGELSAGDRSIFESLFPVLTCLLASYPNESVSVLITDVCTAIATKGLVKLQDNRNVFSSSCLIEETETDLVTDPELREALDLVEDREVPNQAYGVDILTRLLVQRNEDAFRHRVRIYTIVSRLLFHEEPFLYVRAIHSLAHLVDKFTEKLLPAIVAKIRNHRLVAAHQVQENMVLGEVLLKIIRNLGPLAPQYRDLVLNLLMCQLSDPEEMIRSSAATNLGEMCCLLGYSFGPVMHEIILRVCRLLELDQSGSVRVACALMLRTLIVGPPNADVSNIGVGFDALELAPVLKTIRDSLVRVACHDTDPIVLDHVAATNKCLSDAIKAVPLLDNTGSEMNRYMSVAGLNDISISFRKINM